jgi:dephospho-CoA kinase
MLKVALTGGIATGKSYVRTRIAARGVPTLAADAVVHELFAAGSDVAVEVADRFGKAMMRPDGAVDRRALGPLVFRNESARRDLESIVHPRVYERIGAWMALQAQGGAGWALAEIPLLFETGREGQFDRVIVAACAPDQQLQRLVQRDGLAESAARARLAAQWPIAEKVRRATDVIDTSAMFEDTDRQVDVICGRLDDLSRGLAPVRPR